MSNKNPPGEARVDALKNEAARQRWALFHRAIAYAKQSNSDALARSDEAEQGESGGTGGPAAPERPETRLSIAR